MKPSALEPIRVEILLADKGLSAAERCLFESRVSDEVNGLIQDLGLPAVGQVRVVDRVLNQRQTLAPMAVEIDGQQCRQQIFPSEGWLPTCSSELVSFASSEIHANRHLLLTDSVLRAIANTRSAHVTGIVWEMVRKRVSLDAAESVADKISLNLDAESRRYLFCLSLDDCTPSTITVEVGENLQRMIKEASASPFSDMIREMREDLFYDLGVHIPTVRVVCNEGLPYFDFRINLFEFHGPVFRGLRNNEFLVDAVASDLKDTLEITASFYRYPGADKEFSIVTGEGEAYKCKREMENLILWNPTTFLAQAIKHVCRVNAEHLLTASNIQTMLSKLSEASPLLIVNILERFQPRFLLNVLRALVREGFSIRDLRSVFEAMLEVNEVVPHIANDEILIAPPSAKLFHCRTHPAEHQESKRHADSVRVAMKRYVTAKFAKAGEVKVLEISKSTENRLRGCLGRIPAQEFQSLVDAIASEKKGRKSLLPVVVLTTFDLRRVVREAIEIEFPSVAVLCREELEEGIVWREHIDICWPSNG